MWIEESSGKILKNHVEIRALAPDISLPVELADDDIASIGILPVKLSEPPIVDGRTRYVVEASPEKIDGSWTQQWRVVDMTQAQIDEIASAARAAAFAATKAARHDQIAAIVVTTSNGNAFDGDEKSQDRMARALAAMDDADTLPWVLHDNSVAVVGRSELREALRLAGAEMAAIWIGVYA